MLAGLYVRNNNNIQSIDHLSDFLVHKVYKPIVLFKRETFSGALVWFYKQVLLLVLIFNPCET